jgi:hypothetical protein
MADETPNVGESVAQVANLLIGKPESGGDPAPSEAPSPLAPPADADSGEPELTPKVVAERLGIKPDELFTQMRIPVDGGEPLTLEDFKANGKELRGLKAAQNELAEEKVTFENSVMLQRQTLEKTLAKIPPELLTKEMISEVQAEHAEAVDRERIQLHTIRPDLKDPAKWNATRELLITHLAPYGFHVVEVDSIIDHRLAKYVIDNAEREARIKALDADSLQPEKPSRLPRARSQPQPPSKRAPAETKVKRGSPREDKIAKVAELIGARPKNE